MRRLLDRKFKEYHSENPEIYHELVELCRRAKRAGRTRLGIKMLFEIIRWNRTLLTTDDFRLNNNFHSRYARLLMRQEPDLAGMFNLRALK